MPPSTIDAVLPVQAFVGLGANLGDAHATLLAALAALAALPSSVLRRSSPVYRSAPLDARGPDYFNAVAWLETRLDPFALLAELQRIEQAHGRKRPYRNAPRTLDLDLLLYGQQRIDSAVLTVPHPRLHERAFVVRPLVDMAPDLSVPGLGRAQDLLARVAGQQADKLPR